MIYNTWKTLNPADFASLNGDKINRMPEGKFIYFCSQTLGMPFSSHCRHHVKKQDINISLKHVVNTILFSGDFCLHRVVLLLFTDVDWTTCVVLWSPMAGWCYRCRRSRSRLIVQDWDPGVNEKCPCRESTWPWELPDFSGHFSAQMAGHSEPSLRGRRPNGREREKTSAQSGGGSDARWSR